MFDIVIFHSENELHIKEIKQECQKENWVPVATSQNKIICFNNIDTGKRFIKRNFKKNIFVGLICLSEDDLEKIKKHYEFEQFSWPKKINDINFEVVDLNQSPLLKINH